MAFIPWPNGVKLCFEFATAGSIWETCFSLRKSAGAPTSTDLETVVGDGVDSWTAALKGLLTEDTLLGAVRATDMTAEGAPQFVQAVNETGTQTGPGAPLNACAVISGRTAKRGRSYRGRNYVSGLLNGDFTNPVTLGSGLQTALATWATGLQTALDGDGFDIVVASQQHNGVPTSPADLNEVIAFVVDSKSDSQRRRLAGRGT